MIVTTLRRRILTTMGEQPGSWTAAELVDPVGISEQRIRRLLLRLRLFGHVKRTNWGWVKASHKARN